MSVDAATKGHLMDLTASIIGNYVSNNAIATIQMPEFILNIYATLASIAQIDPALAKPNTPSKPTKTQIQTSITPGAIISFIDGKPYKSPKPHLNANGYNADSYRDHYGLPSDYLMVSPHYSAKRSKIRTKIKLGSMR